MLVHKLLDSPVYELAHPGPDNSNLVITEIAVPAKPESSANIGYRVPISFAFHDINHLYNPKKNSSFLNLYIK